MQRQKRNAEKPTLWGYSGYSDIRGGSLDRGHQTRVVSSKIAIFASYGRYIFRNFIYETRKHCLSM